MKSYNLLLVTGFIFVATMFQAQSQQVHRVKHWQTLAEPPQTYPNSLPPLLLGRQAQGITATMPDVSTDAVNAQKIGVSSNFYGYLNTGQKQMSILNDLNTVSFVFRNDASTTGIGNSGHIRYNISSNRGASWVTVPNTGTGAGIGLVNPTQTFLARCPNSFLFTSPTNTSANAKLGVLSATLDMAGIGANGFLQTLVGSNIFANNVTPNVTQEEYIASAAFYPQHITERVPGEFWATMYGDISVNDTVYVLKGTYNNASQNIAWTFNDKLVPNWHILNPADNARHWVMPKIEFSPNGNVGYVAVLGDIDGGQDSVYQPVLWEYNAGTTHFSGAYEVSINQFPELSTWIRSFIDDSSNQMIANGMATCAYNFDLSVDMNGNPHIMCLVGASGTGIVSQNPIPYTIIAGCGMQVMDITKDNMGNWNMIKIAEQLTFGEVILDIWPERLDPSMHLSRSADGEYIFYTWSDTDTTGNSMNIENNAPNLKGCFYSVATQMQSPVIDWTHDDNLFFGNGRAPKTPNRVFEVGAGACPNRTFNVPTIIGLMAGHPSANSTTSFYYLDNINYNCADATIAARMFGNCSMYPIAISANTISASSGQNNGSIVLSATGGLGNYSYQILNAAGGVVSNTNAATGLSFGTYTVMVSDSFGCGDTLTLGMNTLSIGGSLDNISTLKAYPNPATNSLNVQMVLEKAEDIEISLSNVAGQTILSKKIVNATSIINQTLDIANFNKGIYFLKVTNTQGSVIEKIVIE